MNAVQRRSLVVLGFAVVVAALGNWLHATADTTTDPGRYAATVGRQVEGWTCLRQWEGTQDEIEVLGTQDILHRSYARRGGRSCYLSIVRAENRRSGVHDPLTCFRGQGWETMRKRPVSMTLPDGREIPAMEVIISKEGDRRLVWFSFKTGNNFARDFWQQQAQVFWTQLTSSEQAHAALIRMETRLAGDNPQQDRKRLERFVADMLPEVLRRLP